MVDQINEISDQLADMSLQDGDGASKAKLESPHGSCTVSQRGPRGNENGRPQGGERKPEDVLH